MKDRLKVQTNLTVEKSISTLDKIREIGESKMLNPYINRPNYTSLQPPPGYTVSQRSLNRNKNLETHIDIEGFKPYKPSNI
jgi:hypothetical protein